METQLQYTITPTLEEDLVWRNDVLPLLRPMAPNVEEIWQYCFTEIFNNAIDHSGGSAILVEVARAEGRSEIMVSDNGVGIFEKIKKSLGLLDVRHALLELAKGKLTTDPERHSGQGIFFTSRMLDHFQILSQTVYFNAEHKKDDWILELKYPYVSGTAVFMNLADDTHRTCSEVFLEYSSAFTHGARYATWLAPNRGPTRVPKARFFPATRRCKGCA